MHRPGRGVRWSGWSLRVICRRCIHFSGCLGWVGFSCFCFCVVLVYVVMYPHGIRIQPRQYRGTGSVSKGAAARNRGGAMLS